MLRDLALHLLRPALAQPDQAEIRVVDGEEVTVLELVVAPEDRDTLEADDARILRNARVVISAAAGSKKASLDLVDAFSDAE